MKKIGILTKFKDMIEKKKKTAALDAVFNNIIAAEENELSKERKIAKVELELVDDVDTISVEEVMYKELAKEIMAKGFMEPNSEYVGGDHLPMEFVSIEPEKYVINECLTACKILWGKNIYTYSSSNYNDDYCSITVLIDSLSDENMDIIEKYNMNELDKYGVKIIRNGNYLEFRINAKGIHSKIELANFAAMFTIQDVPENTAYLNVSDIDGNYAWYLENLKPGYVVDGDSGRIFFSAFHYYKHMRYLDTLRVYEDEFKLKKSV